MKSAEFIKVLRKVIREEVRAVIQEEMSLLSEAKAPAKAPLPPAIKSVLPKKPQQPQKPIAFTSNNSALNDLLNETYQSANDWKTVFSGNTQMAPNFSAAIAGEYGAQATPVVESVDQMLQAVRPTNDINQVSIDVVPDFSKLMGKLKEDGKL